PLLEIDAAMREFGMPMGPFEVLDEVGLDVAKNAAEVLTRAFPERMTLSPILGKMVAAGRLGKKSGLGFYRHRGRERKEAPGLRAGCGEPARRAERRPPRPPRPAAGRSARKQERPADAPGASCWGSGGCLALDSHPRWKRWRPV